MTSTATAWAVHTNTLHQLLLKSVNYFRKTIFQKRNAARAFTISCLLITLCGQFESSASTVLFSLFETNCLVNYCVPCVCGSIHRQLHLQVPSWNTFFCTFMALHWIYYFYKFFNHLWTNKSVLFLLNILKFSYWILQDLDMNWCELFYGQFVTTVYVLTCQLKEM